jgi:hypothetical protein
MQGQPAQQSVGDSESLRREWENLRKDDPDAVSDHLAKLRVLAIYLNAQVVKSVVPRA